MKYLGGSWARRFGFVACAGLALACSGGDDGDDGGNDKECPTGTTPQPFELTNVEPAAGASVPNTGIVHRFKIMGSLYVQQIGPSFPAAHTAGESTDPEWAYIQGQDGTSYESTPVTWTTAPGHVQVDFVGAYQSPADGCIWEFPSPVFSYDITAP